MADNPALPLPKAVEAELVLQRLRSDKSLEVLQQETLLRLKDNLTISSAFLYVHVIFLQPEYNLHVQELVKKSKAIKREGPQRQIKLREELEDRVIEDAINKYWEILNSRDKGMAIKIESHVQAALMEVFVEHSRQESGAGPVVMD
ncbi:hypothetical protein NADE_006347 [Nannochloris sp. 'desiccata']|nr:hypothetical protein NADE_006347 [Chlorella desiccata (nom. nud.)]